MMPTDRSIEDIRADKREQLKTQIESEPSTSNAAPREPIQIDTPEELHAVTDQYEVVLADFYADWCGPCQMLEPVISGIATETPAAVAKIDVDTHQQLAREYGVQGVPTLVLFANGDTVEQLVGVQQYDHLASLIDQYST